MNTVPIAVHVQGISKKYTIGRRREASYGTLRDEIATRMRNLAKSLVHPFSGMAQSAVEAPSEEFWALRDLTFEVACGERLGIIGRNGAGKSTLLKILSRIVDPTQGSLAIRGRVASLLEVGTGFHPELTGRENVFLNGAILGMKRSEILRRFDEIVAFAEVDKFVDTPVKHYSSGMTVRLAFAVAAHLETDILIADEVLAVGDLSFQRKSLGKMEDAARQGRTVLFVSHNLGAVRNLCDSLLLIEQGRLRFRGSVEEGVAMYEQSQISAADLLGNARFQGPLSDRICLEGLVYRQLGSVVTIVDPRQDVDIELKGKVLNAFDTLDLSISIFRDGFHLGSCHDAPPGSPMREGGFVSRFRIPANLLKPGRFTVGIGAVASSGDWAWCSDDAVLDVSESWEDPSAARDRGAMSLRYSAERSQ